MRHLSEKVGDGFKRVDNRFVEINNKVDNGFKRLDRWMMILVGYPLIKMLLCFGGDSCYSSLSSRAGLIVRTPHDCLRGKIILIKIHLGFIPLCFA